MAIAEKLQNIMNEKTSQATMTNYGLSSEEQINSNTKFIDYPKYIFKAFIESLNNPETLWGNLPKITGTGTSVTLDNTISALMDIELNPSTLEQATTTGKNLADISILPSYTAESLKFIVENNTITIKDNTNSSGYATSNRTLQQLCPTLQVGDTVTLNFNNTSSVFNKNDIYLAGYNNIWRTTNDKTITQEMLDSTVIFYGGYNETAVISNFMIRKNTTTNTYEQYTGGIASPNPDYPQQIHTISGDNEIVVSNKNLASLRNDLQPYGGSATTTMLVYENSENRVATLIPIKSNTKYTMFSEKDVGVSVRRWFYYDQEPIIASSISGTGTMSIGGDYGLSGTNIVKTFTTPATAKYLFIQWTTNNSTTPCGNVALYEGEYTAQTIPSYVSHKEQDYSITLGDIEYCKIGDYSDRIFKNVVGDVDYSSDRELGKWYIKKNIGKVVLDGTEDGWSNQFGTNLFNNATVGSNMQFAVGQSLSNYYKYNSVQSGIDANTSNGDFVLQLSGVTRNMFLKNTSYSNVNDFKSWLSSHNTIIYYPLATPTYTLLNDTLQTELDNLKKALSYKEQTNLSQVNNDLPFIMDITAIEDIG